MFLQPISRQISPFLRAGSNVCNALSLSQKKLVFSTLENFGEATQRYSSTRVGSVDQLNKKGNLPITTLDQYPGLERDADGYKLNISIWDFFRNPKIFRRTNPYRADLETGMIRWTADVPVDAGHVAQVIKFSENAHRKLHVNTGTHGDRDGNTVVQETDYGEALFTKEDMKFVWNNDNVSIHIVSQQAGAIYPRRIDVIDAWCYSKRSTRTQRGHDDIESFLAEVQRLVQSGPTINFGGHAIANTVVTQGSHSTINYNTFISGKMLGVALLIMGVALAALYSLSKPPVRNQLINPPSDFIGRSKEISQIQQAIKEQKMVSIIAHGGIGKTSLVHKAFEDKWFTWRVTSAYPDGIIFYSFYDQPSIDKAALHIIRSLDAEVKNNEQPLDALQRILAQRQVLLVLDGTEKLREHNTDQLQDLLDRVAHSGIIITSRDNQDSRGEVIHLPPLDKEQGTQLLEDLTSSEDATALKELGAFLGNVPLALRLAGSYISATEESPQAYLAWAKEHVKDALAKESPIDAKYASTYELMQRSIQNLSESSQKVLSILGKIAHKSFDVHMLQEVMELDARAIREIIAELRRYGLLTYDTTPKLIHPLLHTFVNQHLDPELSLLKKTLTYYALNITEAFCGQPFINFSKMHFNAHVHSSELLKSSSTHFLASDADFKFYVINLAIYTKYFELMANRIVLKKNALYTPLPNETTDDHIVLQLVILRLVGFLIRGELDQAKNTFKRLTQITQEPEIMAIANLCLCYLEPDWKSAFERLSAAEKYFSTVNNQIFLDMCKLQFSNLLEKYHLWKEELDNLIFDSDHPIDADHPVFKTLYETSDNEDVKQLIQSLTSNSDSSKKM